MNNVIKLSLLSLALSGFNTYAGSFSLEPYSDNQYILKGNGNSAFVDTQGANALMLVDEFSVTCEKRHYLVPLVKGRIDNGESNAESFEYFVFNKNKDTYSPLKTVSSYSAIDRKSGEVITSHLLNPASENFTKTLCIFITNETDFEYPIQVIDNQL
ncbi:hypothetical protein [Photobacterium sanguinicancri]|uniref:hypothetical protein n=1 Tax=Photobacterium sanguinicancri TaxID=875932 RepID=UPI0024817492|nr:hypothetical protein [Photobacterium sanguinicancri]